MIVDIYWQDISIAPKDGTKIVVLFNDEEVDAEWSEHPSHPGGCKEHHEPPGWVDSEYHYPFCIDDLKLWRYKKLDCPEPKRIFSKELK